MTIHRLKTWPSHFRAIVDGSKTFELRYAADRDFAVGDHLVLDEWDPNTGAYVDDSDPLVRVVTYLIDSPRYGLTDDWVAMAIAPVTEKVFCDVIDRAPEQSAALQVSAGQGTK